MDFCRDHLSGQALNDAFILTCDQMRRYGGAWHIESRPMFPGYIFIESDDDGQLREEVGRFRRFAGSSGRSALMRLEDREAEFLQGLCGAEHHMGMSRGYIRNGQTYVTEGPLMGHERLIRKIDRHRRMARVEVPGKTAEKASDPRIVVKSLRDPGYREMYAGLEIVSKS